MPTPLRCDCDQSFEAPAAMDGPFATCPSCGRDVLVPRPGPPAPRVRGWAVLLGVVCGCLLLVGLFLPAVRTSRGAAQRSQCVNNLKQIGLALHNYHEAYGSLPPAAIVGKDGRPLLSWRVLILPYLEQQGDLYAQFRLDEPWDSPHNRPLAAAMPRVFACPSDFALEPGSGLTGYQVVVGPSTAFPPDARPVRFDNITDGAASTLLVGESTRSIPWTSPDDLRDEEHPSFAGLGGQAGVHVGGFNALFADGHVRFLKFTIDPTVLRALLTRSGGEAISTDRY